jgi:hypothetical protein
MTDRRIFFLAHAGRDVEHAKELRNYLHPEIPVFLDVCDLSPGDRWEIELPRRQRDAIATVALVSRAAEPSYYLSEEITAAIAYQRHEPKAHRLIPVFLNGIPNDPSAIPYGLRVLHSLDGRLGMKNVAAELRKLAAELSGVPPPARAPDRVEAPDRVVLFEMLCTLLSSQFEEILFRVDAPKQHLAPASESLSRRALDLVQWAGQGDGTEMHRLRDAIAKVRPGSF